MKLRLKDPVLDLNILKLELARDLPRYRYTIRTGRSRSVLVVGDGQLAAFVEPSLGGRIRIVGGFHNEWIQLAWVLALFYTAAGAFVGGVSLAARFGGAGLFGRGLPTSTALVALALFGGLLVLRRRLAEAIVRDVAASLEKTRG